MSNPTNFFIQIRKEQPGDEKAIHHLNVQAFGGTVEANLVDQLRKSGCPMLSLVATYKDAIVGHILFSPVLLDAGGFVIGMGLGPMAVAPEIQRQRVGTQLAEFGIKTLKNDGYPFLVVLGHPDYYPRFGFEPAHKHHLRCEWEVPKEAFMTLIFDHDRMNGTSGLVKYRPEFSAAAP